MDRFIRPQKNDSTNGGLHLKKGQAQNCSKQTSLHAEASFETPRGSRVAEEKLTQRVGGNLIGLNVVFITVILVCIGILFFETRLPDSYIEVEPFRVHLQTATAAELELMPGIGPKMSQRIIAYRETHTLKTADDLDGVFGIGTRKIEHLRWLVATDGEQK